MSTPTSLELPAGVRYATIRTGRGRFAALEASPVSGVCEREPALLVPGYTGSKEDFLAIAGLLAGHGRRVVAIDMRGQFETPGAEGDDGYSPPALGADIAALVDATGARHLLGHSYGGLIAREGLLGMTLPVKTGPAESGRAGSQVPGGIASFTLMSSGPSALTGPRGAELRAMLAALGVGDGTGPEPAELRARICGLWLTHLKPQAEQAGVPGTIVAFLARRMLSNDPNALVHMARHLLSAPDRTAELARLEAIPMLVLYGEDDDAWSPGTQQAMARRLGARRVCIPAAAHSPAVEAPAITAAALTRFWDDAEAAAAACAAGSRARP